jgi:hypothetical protein
VDSIIQQIIRELGIYSALALITYLLLKFMMGSLLEKIDNQSKHFATELEIMREQFRLELEAVRGFIEKNTNSLTKLSIILLQLEMILLKHDARVRGINPDTGISDKERESEAVRVYQEILGILRMTEMTLRENGNNKK